MRKKLFTKNKPTTKKLLSTLFLCLAVTGSQNPIYAATWAVHDEASLTNALQNAQAGDVIELQNNITFTNSDLLTSLSKNITIDGQSLYHLEASGDLHSINNGTFTNGDQVMGYGGAIQVTQDFNGSINNSSFANNQADYVGGGAISIGQDFSGGINNSSFTNNQAIGGFGGAINITRDFTGDINYGSFTNNQSGYGGAIYVGQNFVGNINHSTFSDNQATSGFGGAICAWINFSCDITNSTFANNQSLYGGGAIYSGQDFTSNITNSFFTNNQSGYGGAIYIQQNFNGNITNNTFTDNQATSGDGGAISVQQDFNGNITNNSFTNNRATTGWGGAFYVGLDYIGNIDNSSFTDNQSESGGAILIGQDFTGNITNSSFTNNQTSGGSGGAIRFMRDFNGSINGSSFTNNQAVFGDGGAIYAQHNFDGSINNSSFIGNQATVNGGAISVWYEANISVDYGANSYFYNNTVAGNPNSIHFENVNNGDTATLNTHGSLYLYDPITGANNIPLYKNGSGLLLLGGNNQNIGSWDINQGTLRLTYDSAGNKAQITGSTDFTLNSGSTLEIVPDVGSGNAGINTTNPTTLNGNTTVGSDYRYHSQIGIGNNQTLLEVTSGYTGGNLINTSGSFYLGQYKYLYDGLHWDSSTELKFNILAANLNNDVTGVYSANAFLRTNLANKTPLLILDHLQTPFQKLKISQIPQANLTTNQDKQEHDLWGTSFYNQTYNKSDDAEASSKAKVPGLILGKEEQISKNSFFGGAISVTWPDYKQGSLKSDGKDIRINLYGGTLLKNDWELGYLISAGFGDMSQDRSVGGGLVTAKYDTSSYDFALSLAKDFHKNEKLTLRPFFTYEYIKANSDGYTENDPVLGITAGGQSNTLHRIRLGNQWHIQQKENTYLRTSLYYQGLYGDTRANIYSFMNSAPGNPIYVSGSSMSKHALGFSLLWGKKLSEKVNFNFAYDGTFGDRGMSNDFRFNVNFRF